MQHVSGTFRKNSINNGAEADKSTKQVVLFKPEESTPAPSNNVSRDVKPSVGFTPDLKGLSIINQGHLTLHYHSYNEAPSSTSQPAMAPLKGALDRSEDEQYSEALSSLMDFDLSPQDIPRTLAKSKRQRMEEPEDPEDPEIEMVEPEPKPPQKKVKQEEKEQSARKTGKNKSIITCKRCGERFNPNQKKRIKQLCNYHPGMWTRADRVISYLSRFRRWDGKYRTNA